MRKKITKSANVIALLGNVTKKEILQSNPADNKCIFCSRKIPPERINALKMLGTARTRWSHTACSQTTKIKGIYMGEVGTSKLQLCDKVYNDSVRSMFKKSEVEIEPDEEPVE